MNNSIFGIYNSCTKTSTLENASRRLKNAGIVVAEAIAFMRTLNLIHLLLRDQQRVVALVSTSAVHVS